MRIPPQLTMDAFEEAAICFSLMSETGEAASQDPSVEEVPRDQDQRSGSGKEQRGWYQRQREFSRRDAELLGKLLDIPMRRQWDELHGVFYKKHSDKIVHCMDSREFRIHQRFEEIGGALNTPQTSVDKPIRQQL